LPSLALIVVLIGGPAVAGIFNYVRCMCDDDERTSLSQYITGMRVFAVRSWILLGVQAATATALIFNFRFYGGMHSAVTTPVLLLMVMLAAMWAMAGSYAWPLLVRGMSWRLLARNSFFLALAAPVSTLLMVISLTLVSAILTVTRIGPFIFLFPLWAVTENVALARLVRIFRARQEQFESADSSASDT
jgi:uncharacterized membrane protein YesL